jgi:hypothetical protein
MQEKFLPSREYFQAAILKGVPPLFVKFGATQGELRGFFDPRNEPQNDS